METVVISRIYSLRKVTIDNDNGEEEEETSHKHLANTLNE